MYSPKIRDDLIPVIYRLARAKGVRMTALVNQILVNAVNELTVIQGKEEKRHEADKHDRGIGEAKAFEMGSKD